MSSLLTDNAIALRALMSETIFAISDAVQPMAQGATMVAEHADNRNAITPPLGVGGISEDGNTESFVYQGDKTSGILFVLRDPDHPYFSPAAEEAFAKTLGALGLTPQSTAVVNLASPNNSNDFRKLMDFFQPKKIALLGVGPTSLKLPEIPQNTSMKGKKATVFHTFGFAEMLADPGKKKAFWTGFKAFMAG